MTCQSLYSVDFVLKPDSAAGKTHYAKWKAGMDNVNLADSKAIAAAAHELSLTQLGIAIGENPPYLRDEIHDPMTRLTIPGVPLAYRLTRAPRNPGEDPVVHTSLFFGDWAAFPFDKNTYVKFPFVHKPGSPNIETLRVTISGLPEVVDPMLKQIDWTKLAQALTK
jgi:hypothetical protein